MPTVLVTGSTDGIGLQTALELSRRGADVILHGRSRERLAAAAKQVEAEAGRAPDTLQADFASLRQVEAMADATRERWPRLDVLLCNAGLFCTRKETSEDGFELAWAVNHLAHLLLVHRLLPVLQATAGSRIVNVSSIAHHRGWVFLDDLSLGEDWTPYTSYAQSKVAQVIVTVELARRLGGGPPTVNALHPGIVPTKLLLKGMGFQGRDSLQSAADTCAHVALSDAVRGVSGRYFAYAREAEMAPVARDPGLGRLVYERSCEQIGVEPLPAPDYS